MERLKPTLVHGTIVPEIDDTFSPDAIDFVGTMIMKGLSCTFTWYTRIRVPEDHELDELVDRLSVSSSTWHRIIELCHIAVSYHVKGDFKKSKSFLAESFIPLLEVHGIQTNCAFTMKHREALKHVLDSTSAFIQLSSCDDHEARRNLYNYAKTVTSFDSMDKCQRAGVHAIRSRLSDYPDNMLYAREAVKLNPEEGRWHYYLAEALFEADQRGEFKGRDRSEAYREIMKHNQISLSLCQDSPEPLLLMAEILVSGGDPESCEKAYLLIQNVLKKFPNSAYAHMRGADILQMSQQSFDLMPRSYLLIEPFYQKAIKLAKKECALLRHKLGLHQVLMAKLRLANYEGIYKEGIKNLELAALSIHDANIHLMLAGNGLLDSSVVGIHQMPRPLPWAEDSSSESSEPYLKTVEVSKKSKKKKGKGKRK
ncbi:3-hydroxy-3-methylglutaryl-coenzyme A reductase 1 [Frankliniella fusca]|uniref:3-hydroxy-3-methylglutaryl-coenzyme A reductase 1 n=1 Tax=Frankliniella fusca TaxID=407009 RepID=A0AAE1H9R7_9NEOP|nr:3-hydroxy-3-methylglutaryl-coenzyme A reductase 1 [Frankliniella fusca]